MSLIIPVVGIGIATLGGVGWYASTIITASKEIDDPLRSIAVLEVQKDLQEDDLIDIGTGQQAEEKLGSELSNSRDLVLISGAVNTTVFSLIRNYLPSRVVLQVLVNPKFSKPMYLSRIASTYSGKVRSTEKILSDDITIFFIDTHFHRRGGIVYIERRPIIPHVESRSHPH